MSEDWKNERAEAAMIEGTEAIRKAAEEKANQEEIKKWFEIAESLYIGDSEADSAIDFVINEMRQKYHLPLKK